jgi:hypothetical protein
MKLQAPNGMILNISWSHPEQNLDPIKTLPFNERNERNDIRRINGYLLQKHYEKHSKAFEKEMQCIRCKNLKPDEGGYLSVNIDYQWFRFTHVIKMFENKENIYDLASAKSLEVRELDCSHLCGNNWCCNSEHLHFEHHSTNMERQSCHWNGKCSKGHEPYCVILGKLN